MKKFIYRFENVYNLKLKQEEQARINYGNMMAQLIEEENKLEVMLERQEQYMTDKRKLMSSKLQLLKIRECEAAIEQMKLMIKQQRLEIKRAENQVEIARKELNEAMIERKTYEKLKERDFEKFKLEYEKEERKEIDELVSYNYSTGGSDGKEKG